MKILLGGIAGTGMNVLAQYLIGKQHEVYGFDRNFDRGERLHIKHFLEAHSVVVLPEDTDISGFEFDQMIMTPAIEQDHPILVQGRHKNIPLKMRSCIITDLFNAKKGLGVCGTSGKTSTTAILAYLLKPSLDPDIFLGAPVLNWKNARNPGNFHNGSGEHFILEIDESDRRLHEYYPEHLIITNIDHDHHSVEIILGEFKKIIQQTNKLVINLDCPRLNELMKGFEKKQTVTYSINDSAADFYLSEVKQEDTGLSFKVNGIDFFMPVMGAFYAVNALPACALAVSKFNLSLTECSRLLSTFAGVEARFEYHKMGKHHFIFDFAHNPSKIEMAARSAKKFNVPVIYVFQPHGYTPLRECFDDMVRVFQNTFDEQDMIYLQKVYDVGGTADRSINSDHLVEKVNRKNVTLAQNRKWLEQRIIDDLKRNESMTVIISGARDDTLRTSLHYISGHFEPTSS